MFNPILNLKPEERKTEDPEDIERRKAFFSLPEKVRVLSLKDPIVHKAVTLYVQNYKDLSSEECLTVIIETYQEIHSLKEPEK